MKTYKSFKIDQKYKNNIDDTCSLQQDHLAHLSMMYGLLTLAIQKKNNSPCYKELEQIFAGIEQKKIWAIKGLKKTNNFK